jgi:hypothetical protein
LTTKEIASGYVNRHLAFNTGPLVVKRAEPKYSYLKCPASLVTGIKKIVGDKPATPGRQAFVFEENGREVVVQDRYLRIGWTAEAKARWIEYEESIRSLPSEERELWIRAPEIGERIATIETALRGSKTIDLESIRWGIEVAKQGIKELARGLDKHQLEEYEQADLIGFIRDLFRRKHEVTRGAICKACERKTKDHRQIGQAINFLIDCGDIIDITSKGAGRPTNKWRWVKQGKNN